MLENTEAKVAKIGVRLIDDRYLSWLGAESEPEMMLRGWCDATGSGAKRCTSLIERRSGGKRRRHATRSGCGAWLRPAMTPSSGRPKECPIVSHTRVSPADGVVAKDSWFIPDGIHYYSPGYVRAPI
jgi:hypothetical protein